LFIGQALKTQCSLFVFNRIEVNTIHLACHATDCSFGVFPRSLACKPESGHDSGDPLCGVDDRRNRVADASCFFGQVPSNLRPHSTAHPLVSRVTSPYIATGLERKEISLIIAVLTILLKPVQARITDYRLRSEDFLVKQALLKVSH
jgi:hypothetical protein